LLTILSFMIFSTSCVTSIKRIEKNSTRFQGKKVVVKGRVISSLDLKEINCFTIRDNSSKILVVTENMLPLKNDRIKVKGIIEQQYPYKEQNFLVVKEKKLKLRKPPKFKNVLEKL